VSNWRLWLPPALVKPRVRLYMAGHIVSVLGNWLQQIALAWLVWRLTGDVFLLGLVGFLLNISYLLFGGVAGSLVDRLPRMQFLIAIDLASATLGLVLAAMVFSGVTAVLPYLVVAAVVGIASGFEMPVRQSLFKDIVEDKNLLPSAIALSALVYNVGRMIGPAIAGFMLLYVSEGWCFLLNALSYTAIIAALFAMNLPLSARTSRAAGPRSSFRENLAVVTAFPGVRYLLPIVVALGLFVTPYAALMPSIVAELYDGKPSTVGLLMGAAGLGAFLSALYLSLQPGYQRQLRLASIAPYITGAALVAFAFSRNVSLSVVLLAVLGSSMMLSTNSINALLQQSTPDEWRGRVIGLYAMSFAGTAPVGALLSGAMAAQMGVTATLAFGGIATIVAGLIGRRRLHAHPEAMRSLVRALRA
jgi:MFS family permease